LYIVFAIINKTAKILKKKRQNKVNFVMRVVVDVAVYTCDSFYSLPHDSV
jgi:uncharacterized protein with PQ loop repeat